MTEEKKDSNEETIDLTIEDVELTEKGQAEEVFGEAEATDIPSQESNDKSEELQKKLEEAENRYYRLQADFDNYRRRVKLDAEAAEKYRTQGLMTDILPALDSFERALKMEADTEASKSLLQGMEMVYRSLLDALKKEGLQPIESVGNTFDPYLHQAVMQIEDETFSPNTVVEEFQKGYVLKDRVIRPSMVKVNQ